MFLKYMKKNHKLELSNIVLHPTLYVVNESAHVFDAFQQHTYVTSEGKLAEFKPLTDLHQTGWEDFVRTQSGKINEGLTPHFGYMVPQTGLIFVTGKNHLDFDNHTLVPPAHIEIAKVSQRWLKEHNLHNTIFAHLAFTNGSLTYADLPRGNNVIETYAFEIPTQAILKHTEYIRVTTTKQGQPVAYPFNARDRSAPQYFAHCTPIYLDKLPQQRQIAHGIVYLSDDRIV
jgi:hypothetical protein